MNSMRRKVALLLLAPGMGVLLLSQVVASAESTEGHATVLKIDGTIDPVSAGFLSRVIDDSAKDGTHLVILQLDTPGGLLSSTRDMVEDILTSEVPVAVYVFPSGAQAASAGTFITAAGHFAVMAPGTNIGAASPVAGGGQDLPETLARKVTQDAAAFIRSIAEERGRNAEALEETVLQARSYSASEAVELNVVDFTTESMDNLLRQLDGLEAKTPSGVVTLDTEGIVVKEVGMNLRERFLSIVANPDIAFLLLSLGSLGLMIEFLNPGVLFPGIFGAIALVLAFVSFGNLPVNWAGVAMLLFSMVLFFMEFQAPGVGVFSVGGAIAFILGALFLFGGFSSPPIETPSFRVSLWLVGSVSAILFAFLAWFLREVRGWRQTAATSTTALLIGQIGSVASDLSPIGTVQLASEIWSASGITEEPISQGEQVRVVKVEGLILKVTKLEEVEDKEEEETEEPD